MPMLSAPNPYSYKTESNNTAFIVVCTVLFSMFLGFSIGCISSKELHREALYNCINAEVNLKTCYSVNYGGSYE